MGWEIGYDSNWHRDIGYGVPSICDAPICNREIDRGLSFVCGGEAYGGEYGCGLYFCENHLLWRKPRGSQSTVPLCPRCYASKSPYNPKPDTTKWLKHKLNDESWERWREENPTEVIKIKEFLTPQRNKMNLNDLKPETEPKGFNHENGIWHVNEQDLKCYISSKLREFGEKVKGFQRDYPHNDFCNSVCDNGCDCECHSEKIQDFINEELSELEE